MHIGREDTLNLSFPQVYDLNDHDLDHGLGQTVTYHRATLIDLYLQTKFVQIGKTCCERTDRHRGRLC